MGIRKNLFVCCLAVCSLLIPGCVGAVAVKVLPSSLEIETRLGVSAKKEIIVENPDEKVALYEVYPDNFSDWIKVTPASFILESKDSKKVSLEVKSKEQGIFSTDVSVVSRPLSERKFKASSGVKIPLEVRVFEGKERMFLASIPTKSLLYILVLLAIPVIFLLLVFLWRKRMLK